MTPPVADFAGPGGLVESPGRAELAPTGTLRAGLVEAPDPGAFFVARGPDGEPAGVTRDLAAHLAASLGLPVAFTVFPNSGAVTEAVRSRDVDLAFMPVDETRRALVAFGPGYFELESTYLVAGGTGLVDVAEVDRPGLRVIGIAGTTTIRASARSLTRTQPVAVQGVADAIALMRNGAADAFALSRDSLAPILPQLPGSRIVTGGFQRTAVAAAVPQGRPAALAAVTAWLEGAKRDGTVARIFAEQGVDAPVAP